MNNDDIPEFGTKRENEERRDGGCGVIFDPNTQKFAVGKREDGLLILFGGGVDASEEIQAGVLREITEESGLYDFLYVEQIGKVICHYHNIPKNINRIADATCFLVVLKSKNIVSTKLEDHENFILHWATADEMLADWESRNNDQGYDHWIYFFEKAKRRIKELGYHK